MQKRSLAYKFPGAYKAMLKIVHGKNLDIRYNYMTHAIGKNMRVLEPAAGPGIIPPYLEVGCTYSGFDINPDFVNDAKKRNIDIKLGNATDAKSYTECDALILVDVIHHLSPENQKTMLKNVVRVTKKTIIICEPYRHSLGALEKIPGISKVHERYFKYIEQDGNNEARLEHIHSEVLLRETMMNGFGVIPNNYPCTIKKIGDDLIAVYKVER